ncbi:MAG: hypothetical protein A2504_00575 [Bdellovibrionales bacterium RIFOXYD12_FULL_39_22]|nr:MAG: hypothetical protein A2385_03705 [Bdellovibrionales bacterium RIFOXYB1_FULL_39_21]OFZ44016.1 MAG: hypothetical protein A2485_03220 [Bdellovibrionales bacterium RIFOXYC12_FULL_39_17]OFZ48036.1 MAG: hypothetical protein A2404_01615 [Bdellovibrionales bacterium RIFOXYC1_FULL_39_130]OFZ76500.1 MAG: hypothetical protein A2560_11835 [Bdellovibrionales bacterium RIFOXYD1_FULL_39_84]OFZ95264.1 MAG: hypothetical protein A2504_00575 [Bdellovibrionales bacterium RIFOXYD12_FULL_39_22]HLE11831.1 hy
MDQKIILKSANWPKVVGDMTHSNQLLKTFSLFSLGIAILSLLIAFVLSNKPSLVLAFNSDSKVLEQVKLPSAQDQVREALNAYIRYRYNWTPQNIKENLNATTNFILPKSSKAFDGAMSEVMKFALEKELVQRAYVNQMEINLKDSTAIITGDRVSSIQGLRAAGELKVLLQFESGERTIENPWGVYIVKEKEE